MGSWNTGCASTGHSGIFKTKNGYRVRVRAIDPRTGTLKEANREYEGITIREALVRREAMRADLGAPVAAAARQRVGDFARSWIKSRAGTIDEGTASRYVDALENHVLPAFGDFFYDTVRPTDVQTWIQKELKAGYRVATVRAWFRTFRTMTRDAMEDLGLERDPTLRIRFPEAEESDEANALTPGQLGALLGAMERLYPHHHALVATLAYTGLRFCHASALRWEDVDEQAGVLRIARKNIRGRIGPVSRRKRAPREYPLHPELARILREHRHRMLAKQAKGLEEGWMFPSANGKARTHTGLQKAWAACLKAAEIKERFTIHGLRRTFNDLSRRAGVDAVVTKSLTGHVTEKMREHYSTVGLDEKRAAVAGVVKLVILPGGDRSGDRAPESDAAG